MARRRAVVWPRVPKVEPGRAVHRRRRAIVRRRRRRRGAVVRRRSRAVSQRRHPRAVVHRRRRRRVVSRRRRRSAGALWPLPLEVDVAPLLPAVAGRVITSVLVPSKWSLVSTNEAATMLLLLSAYYYVPTIN